MAHSISRLAQDTPLRPYQITVSRLELINAQLTVFPFAIATALAGSSHSPTSPGPGSEQRNAAKVSHRHHPLCAAIARRLLAASRLLFIRDISFAAITGAVCLKEAKAALTSAASTEPEGLKLSD